MGVAADASGIRAVTDSVNGRVQLLNPDGSIATVWGSPAPGPTLLPRPVAVAFDAAGNAYVLDQRRSRIVVFARSDRPPRAHDRRAGQRARAACARPSALAIDAGGRISVADTGNERIARFTTGGALPRRDDRVGPLRGIAVTPDGTPHVHERRQRADPRVEPGRATCSTSSAGAARSSASSTRRRR